MFQTSSQYLCSNESAVFETVSLAPSGETVDLFGDHSNGITGTNACPTSYGIMRPNTIQTVQHANSNTGTGSLHQHYTSTPTNLATKRRASDAS